MIILLYKMEYSNDIVKEQWEHLKQTNAPQKEKNTWKKKNLLETDSNKGTWRLMTNGEIDIYFN